MKSQKHMSEDTRIALLEQSINHINETLIRFEKRFDTLDSDIKSNYRWTITTIISLFILSGLMPIFTHWVSKFIN